MDRLIELVLQMPPFVSAFLSLVTLVFIYDRGRKILSELDQQSKEMGDQSKELRSQSKDLGDIKIQTTKTNGRVTAIEKVFEGHNKQDDERHEENTEHLDVIVQNQEAMLAKITHLEGGHHG